MILLSFGLLTYLEMSSEYKKSYSHCEPRQEIISVADLKARLGNPKQKISGKSGVWWSYGESEKVFALVDQKRGKVLNLICAN